MSVSEPINTKKEEIYSLPNILVKFHPKESVYPINSDNATVNVTIYTGQTEYYGLMYESIEYVYDFPNTSQKLILLLTNDKNYVLFVHFVASNLWLNWLECHKTSGNTLIIYVSKNRHNLYPYPQIYIRKFGFANDICSNKGKILATKIVGAIKN